MKRAYQCMPASAQCDILGGTADVDIIRSAGEITAGAQWWMLSATCSNSSRPVMATVRVQRLHTDWIKWCGGTIVRVNLGRDMPVLFFGN